MSRRQIAKRILRQRPHLQQRWQERLASSDADNFHTRTCRCSACRTSVAEESSEDAANATQNSEFPDRILISSTFGDITKDYIDWPNNDTLTYTIFDRERNNSLVTTNSHSDIEEQFISEAVDEVDEIIGLDFSYSESVGNSQIVFVSVDRYRPWGPGDDVAGQVVETKNRWYVLWRDYTPDSDELIDYDKNTIIHELGHALGLSHPNERPDNPRYNTVEDTIMSYNDFNGQWGTEFTENDFDALQMIWGAETTTKVVA